MIPKVLVRFSLSVFFISISLITSCSKPITRLTGNGTAGSNYSSPSNNDDASGTVATGPAESAAEAINQATLIQLNNTKFAGEESNLEATVSLGPITSARFKLTVATAGLTSLTVPSLPTGKSDTLIVQIFEGAKLRFIGKRIATLIENGKANTVTLADCTISKVPWDGSSNEGTCGWSVQDSK